MVLDRGRSGLTFVDGWNDRCHPFVWTKTADEFLKRANRQTISNMSPWRRAKLEQGILTM